MFMKKSSKIKDLSHLKVQLEEMLRFIK